MRQKFYSNTIQSSFIKNLIYSTQLPLYPTVGLGDYLIEGNYYIYQDQVIFCGELDNEKHYVSHDGADSGYFMRDPNHIDDDNIHERRLAKWESISRYFFGEDNSSTTSKFISRYDFYDSETHERLGKYLNCYRDMYDIDLLPFYNCFSGKYQDGITLDDGSQKIYQLMSTENYKTFKIPIRFNKKYTIAIDSDTKVVLAPVVMVGNELLHIEFSPGDSTDITALLGNGDSEDPKYFMISKGSTAFKQPFIFELENKLDDNNSNFDKVKKLNEYERDLYLLIQVSATNESSLVILDGDYTSSYVEDVFDMENIEEMEAHDLNELLIGKLSLLTLSDKIRYPFADRLIEYILLNVITHEDDISQNIKTLQEQAATNNPFLYDLNSFRINGIWTNYFRAYLYYLTLNTDSSLYDITGFGDKDSTYILENLSKSKYDATLYERVRTYIAEQNRKEI